MKLEWIKKIKSEWQGLWQFKFTLAVQTTFQSTHNLLVMQYSWLSQSVPAEPEQMIGLGVGIPLGIK